MIMVNAGLLPAAKAAGMKVPDDPEDYDRQDYPHWHGFVSLQVGVAMRGAHVHWENAKVMAAVSDEEIKEITALQLEDRGFVLR